MIEYPNETIRAISEFLFVETEKDKIGICDLTLVLGNDYIDGTVQELKNLIDQGNIAPGSKIILSGATGLLNAGSEKECLRLRRSAVEKFGIDPGRLVLEDRATNAYENLLYCKELVKNNITDFPEVSELDCFSRILIIGKAFMMRRVEMGARKLGYPMDKLVYFGTVDKEGRNIGKDCWWESETAAQRVYGEIERIGKYAAGGNLTAF